LVVVVMVLVNSRLLPSGGRSTSSMRLTTG
jgi:hypothetical protein